MYLNFGKYYYTIIYVLIALMLVMMFLSYFNINLKPNTNANANIKLTRVAVFEGYNKHNTNNDTETLALNSLL